MELYHYFEKSVGPFRNLSDLDGEIAQVILDEIKRTNVTFAAHRYDGYLARRKELECVARELFIAKGGRPIRRVPHYMVIGACPWLNTWYSDPAFVTIPVSHFDTSTLSFTYGDLFPTFSPRVADGKEYRSTVYTWEEIKGVIARYGLPQEWNPVGEFGPERYVEVQVWCEPPAFAPGRDE
ncbi:MAG: hypothetical protein EA382_04875 [Spirochaetaceae bacterium]|nr:MAG: hypothetical protein EA382_04875 [Spirochaetaceae bacterium]